MTKIERLVEGLTILKEIDPSVGVDADYNVVFISRSDKSDRVIDDQMKKLGFELGYESYLFHFD